MSATVQSPLFTENRLSGKYGRAYGRLAPSGNSIVERMLMCSYSSGLAGSEQQLLDVHQWLKERRFLPNFPKFIPRRSFCVGRSSPPDFTNNRHGSRTVSPISVAIQKRHGHFPSGHMSFKQTTSKKKEVLHSATLCQGVECDRLSHQK